MAFSVIERPGLSPLVTWVPDEAPINYTIVTGSPKGGSGKTSVMVFVATTLARMGARVLVIEATEGQAPLTHAYHPLSLAEERAGQTGLGAHLFQGLAVANANAESFQAAYTRMKPIMAREAKKAISELGKVYATPDKLTSLDFMACGEESLAKVQQNPILQSRHNRRALLQAFLDSLSEQHPGGGWDFIFLDTLPTYESTITKAAMGVGDAYALVVDVESAHPLTGWGAISEELEAIRHDRRQEGRPDDVFKGLILNKIASSAEKRSLVEKINRFLIACERHNAEKQGVAVDILTEIPRMTLLTLLGFNYSAVDILSRRYGKNFPEDLDKLTEADVEAMLQFKYGEDQAGQLLDAAAGVAWLGASLPGHRARLEEEAQSLMPLLFGLAGAYDALDAFLEAHNKMSVEV